MATLDLNPKVNELQAILIISRDAGITSLWESFFELKKYRVIGEANAASGLQSARLLNPALILLDLDLPDDMQLDICRELRSTTNGSLLLLAPGKGKPEIADYHRAGVDEYIPTPISPMALLIKCMTWLARQDWIVPRRQASHLFV